MSRDQVLCANLNELVKKLLLTFCEVNVNFEHHLDIYGSIHIRADNQDVISMMLNERCLKHMAPTSTNSIVNIQVHDTQVIPSGKESCKASPRVPNGDEHYTKVIPSGNASCMYVTSQSSVVSQPISLSSSPGQKALHQTASHSRCQISQLPQNLFTPSLYLDVCDSNVPESPQSSDPYQLMGFIQSSIPSIQNAHRLTQGLKSCSQDNQNQLAALPLNGPQNFLPVEMKDLTHNEEYLLVSSPKLVNGCSANSHNDGRILDGNVISKPPHLYEVKRDSGGNGTHHGMADTENSIPQPSSHCESDLRSSHLSPWQQVLDISNEENNNVIQSSCTSSPWAKVGSGSGSVQDISSNFGGVTYRCRICRRTFSDLKVYSHHVTLCKCQCKLCGSTFSSKQSLDSHVHESHCQASACTPTNSLKSSSSISQVSTRSRFSCTLCKDTFRSRAALSGHMAVHHRQLQKKSSHC